MKDNIDELKNLHDMGYIKNRTIKAYVWAVLNGKHKTEKFLKELINIENTSIKYRR